MVIMNTSFAQWSISKTMSKVSKVMRRDLSSNGSVTKNSGVGDSESSVSGSANGVASKISDNSFERKHPCGNSSLANGTIAQSSDSQADAEKDSTARAAKADDSHRDAPKILVNGDPETSDSETDSDDSDLEHSDSSSKKPVSNKLNKTKSKSHLRGLNVCFYKLK